MLNCQTIEKTIMNLYLKIKSDLVYFLKCLENYNEVPFNKKIKGQGISVGFIYKELCEDFNVRIIENIEGCLAQESKNKGKKTFKGWYTLFFGKSFLDGKDSFSEEFSDKAVYTIDMIKDEIYRTMKKMEKIGADLASRDENTLKLLKTEHNQLGYLNATEWYNLGINNLKKYKSLKEKLDKKINA